MGHQKNVCPCVLSHCRQKQNRGRQRGYIPLCSVPVLAAWMSDWLCKSTSWFWTSQLTRRTFPQLTWNQLANSTGFQILKYVQMSKYPFCDCKMSAQDFPSNLMQFHWKHLDKHHYQKHPITSLRKTMQDSRLDRRLDVNCRFHWQLLDRRQQNRFLLCLPTLSHSSISESANHRQRKAENQSKRMFLQFSTNKAFSIVVWRKAIYSTFLKHL